MLDEGVDRIYAAPLGIASINLTIVNSAPYAINSFNKGRKYAVEHFACIDIKYLNGMSDCYVFGNGEFLGKGLEEQGGQSFKIGLKEPISTELAEIVISSLNEKGLWGKFLREAEKSTRFTSKAQALEHGVYVRSR